MTTTTTTTLPETMSHNQAIETDRAAGGLAGLNLGAPIGTGSTDLNAAGLISASGNHLTSSQSHGTGLTSSGTGSGLTSGTSTGTGLTSGAGTGLTSGVPSGIDHDKYSQVGSAVNTTSGDRGIGGGRGGPTAFESDPSRVGHHGFAHGTHGTHSHVDDHGEGHKTGVGAAASNLTGSGSTHTGPTTTAAHSHGPGHSHHSHSHDHDHSHHSHGTGAAGTRDLVDSDAGIKAGLGAGHHDQSHGTGLAGAGVGAGAAAATAAGLSHHHHHRGTEVDDSVTGQTHFSGEGTDAHGGLGATRAAGLTGTGPITSSSTTTGTGVGAGTAGTGLHSTHEHGHGHGHGTGLATGAGVGAAAGAAGVGAATHGSHGAKDATKELKEELKSNQGSGGYDTANDHPESEGPHGLVWHDGKYVHKRELDGKGSTGVPLK